MRCEEEEEEVPEGRSTPPDAVPRFSETEIRFKACAEDFMRGLNPISRTSGLNGEAKSADRFKATSRDARMNKVFIFY